MPADGRIVAAGGHLHAGARDLTLSDPRCRPRAARRPAALRAARRPGLRGAPGPPRARADRDPLLPLARPGSRSAGASACGSPAATTASTRARGSCRSSTSTSRPARRRRGARCAPLPRDRREVLPRRDGRTDPPYEPVPFNVMDDQGVVGPVEHLPGAPTPLGTRGTVDLVANRFAPEKVALPVGGVLRWRFRDPEAHNVLFAERARRGRLADAPQRDDRRRASAGPGPTGSSAPCTRSRCTRRSSSAERPMSSRAAPRPPGHDDRHHHPRRRAGRRHAAGSRASARAGSRSSCCASACS